MNTKSSEISSGLVAVAWIHTHESYPKKVSDMAPGYWGSAWKHDPLVRLSDAEAIISAKDAEIERLKQTPTIEEAKTTVEHLRAYASDNGYSHGDYADVMTEAANQIEKQSERIKELESDADEEAHIRDRMAQLLAETAVALKGPEKALHRHGWQDLPECAEKQSAALKLAKEALEVMRDSADHQNPAVHAAAMRQCQEALAAINEVIGE